VSQRYSFRPIYLYGGGTVNMIAKHPTNGTLLVAGDIEGMFRSEDSGDNWRIVNRGLYGDYQNRVAFVSWSQTETNTAYIGTGNQGSAGGFYASTDGGITWTLRSATVTFSGNNNTAPLPTSHPRSTGNLLVQAAGTLYTFTFNGGVFRSTDNGNNWTAIGLTGEYGRSLVGDPSDANTLYAATYGNKIYKTTNASAGSPTWTQLTTAPATVEELKFVGGYIYAACGASGIYRSTDGGSTWTSLNGSFIDTTQSVWESLDGYVSGSNHVVIVGCTNPVTPASDGARNLVKLTITSGGVVSYTDLTTVKANFTGTIPPNNQTWWRTASSTNYYDWITGNSHTATYILIDPSDPNRIWTTGGGGIYRSTDGGGTWRPAINGVALTSNRRLLADPNHPPRLWIGNVDWTFFEITDGLAQTPATTLLNAPTSAGVGYSLAIDSTDSRIFLGVGNRDTNTEGQIFSRPYGGSYLIDERLQEQGTLTRVVTDTFTRTATNSWGTADLGGAWSIVAGNVNSFSVDGALGRIQLPAAPGGRALFLGTASARDVTGTVDVTWDKVPTGDTHFTQIFVRSDGTVSNGYTFRIEQTTAGLTTIRFHKISAGVTGQLGGPVNFTANYTPGQTITIRFKAQGANPTNLYMKAWVGGADAEPTNWMMTTTDSDANLQAAGKVGIRASGSTNYTGNALFTYENLIVDSIGTSTDPSDKRPIGLAAGRDASNNRVLLAAVESSGLWRKVNGTWTKVDTTICAGAQASRTAQFVWQSGSPYVYVFDRASGIYRSSDYGVTWTLIWAVTNDTSTTGYIAQDPAQPTVLWVSRGSSGLFKLSSVQSGTVGSGITSTQITEVSLPGALHISSAGHIYVVDLATSSSAVRLMRSPDGGTTWTDISDTSFKAMANRPSDLLVDSFGHIYVATLNDGVLIGNSVGQNQTT
jgi:hypothetical protein